MKIKKEIYSQPTTEILEITLDANVLQETSNTGYNLGGGGSYGDDDTNNNGDY